MAFNLNKAKKASESAIKVFNNSIADLAATNNSIEEERKNIKNKVLNLLTEIEILEEESDNLNEILQENTKKIGQLNMIFNGQ